MLTLARALGRSPKILLADELSLGLAPLVVDRLLSAVRDAADSARVSRASSSNSTFGRPWRSPIGSTSFNGGRSSSTAHQMRSLGTSGRSNGRTSPVWSRRFPAVEGYEEGYEMVRSAEDPASAKYTWELSMKQTGRRNGTSLVPFCIPTAMACLVLLGLAGCATVTNSGQSRPSASALTRSHPSGPAAELTALTGGTGPFMGEATPPDLQRIGYVQHEFTAAGTAASYKLEGTQTGTAGGRSLPTPGRPIAPVYWCGSRRRLRRSAARSSSNGSM